MTYRQGIAFSLSALGGLGTRYTSGDSEVNSFSERI